MHVSPQTALRNRRIVWNHSARGTGAGDLSRAVPAASDTPADRSDTGNHHCVCSDGCTGVTDRATCNGHPDTDRGADHAAPDDGHATHPDANCFTAYRLDTDRCCNDPGDCQPDAACFTP